LVVVAAGLIGLPAGRSAVLVIDFWSLHPKRMGIADPASQDDSSNLSDSPKSFHVILKAADVPALVPDSFAAGLGVAIGARVG
jgi:hypothetical protein